MHLKTIGLAIMLLSIMLISPVLKYQPDLLKKTTLAEIETAELIENTSVAETFAESVPSDEATSINYPPEEKVSSKGRVWRASAKAVPVPQTETETAIEEKESSAAYETQPETAALPEFPSGSEAEESMTELVYSSVDETMVSLEASTAHSHTWTPITEIIHHDRVYQTVSHDAMTEQVWMIDQPAYDESYENTYLVGVHDICKGCGLDITASGLTPEDFEAHDIQHILNGEDSGFYSKAIYETQIEIVHHEEEGHFEEQVIQEAYSETVLAVEAWDEELVVGRRCIECGIVE